MTMIGEPLALSVEVNRRRERLAVSRMRSFCKQLLLRLISEACLSNSSFTCLLGPV
jgi:hypothetical protein